MPAEEVSAAAREPATDNAENDPVAEPYVEEVSQPVTGQPAEPVPQRASADNIADVSTLAVSTDGTGISEPSLSSDASLASLVVISGAFTLALSPDVMYHEVTVPYEVVNPEIVATPNDAAATVKVTGFFPLGVGPYQLVSVTVTAEDGTERDYSLYFNREGLPGSKITDIEVTRLPEKTRYVDGETLNLDGMVVTAIYDDGRREVLYGNSFTTDPMHGEVLRYDDTSNPQRVLVLFDRYVYNPISDSFAIDIVRVDGEWPVPEILDVVVMPERPFFDETIEIRFRMDRAIMATTSKVAVVLTNSDTGVRVAEQVIELELPYNDSGIVFGYAYFEPVEGLYPGNYTAEVFLDWQNTDIQKNNCILTEFFVGPSSDASLASLSASTGTLNPEFDPEVLSYDVTVPYEVESIEIDAWANDAAATVGAGEKTLKVGANRFTVTVTAEDGTTRAYVVNVLREAGLSNLSVSTGTLVPEFDPVVRAYNVTVPYEVEYIVIAAAANAAATVDGTGGKALEVGTNSFTVMVTPGDGTAKSAYIVTIRRERQMPVSIAVTRPPAKIRYVDGEVLNLDGMVVTATYDDGSSHALDPDEYVTDPAEGTELIIPFDDKSYEPPNYYDVYNYFPYNDIISVSYKFNNSVRPASFYVGIKRFYWQDPGCEVDNFEPAHPVVGDPISIDFALLNAHYVTHVSVVLTNSDTDKFVAEQIAELVYNPDAFFSLASGTITFDFEKLGIEVAPGNYTAELYYDWEDTEGIDFILPLADFYIGEPMSGDANLASLSVDGGTLEPEFDPDMLSYDVTVPYEVESIEIEAAVNDAAAMVAGAGEKALEAGANSFTVTVTAADGTTRAYVVNVWRKELPPVLLDGIELTALPDKMEYCVGEALNLSGLEVTAVYNNGVREAVTEYVADPDAGAVLDMAGTQTVAVSYKGVATEFNVTVRAPVATDIRVTTPTIVATLAAYLNIRVTGEAGVLNQTTAILSADDGREWKVDIVNGAGRMYIDSAPAAGLYDLVLSGPDGVALDSCEITVTPYDDTVWVMNTSLDGGFVTLVFNEDITARDGRFNTEVTVDGTAARCELVGSRTLVTDVSYDSLATGEHAFKVSGVKYQRLFPSYSFTFTAQMAVDSVQ